ncbi:MAG: response regulator [Pyrinomonadaceae bacterium]
MEKGQHDWYRVLADVAGGAHGDARAGRIAEAAVSLLGVDACLIQQALPDGGWRVVACTHTDQLKGEVIESMAGLLAAEVMDRREWQKVEDVRARYPGELSLAQSVPAGAVCVPLLDERGAMLGTLVAVSLRAGALDETEVTWLRIAAQMVADGLALGSDNAAHDETATKLTPAETTPSAKIETDEGTRALSILVIDDDRAVNDVLCLYLSEEGYKVEAAYDGLEAVRIFRPARHDVVITDVAMPHMNGWELIAALRVRAPTVPIILITGFASGNWNPDYLRRQGVIGVLNKPLDLDHLKELLDSVAKS